MTVHLRFFDALERMNPAISRNLSRTIKKLEQNPSQPGLNCERLGDKTSSIWSARINQSHRLIFFKSPNEDLISLLYVGNHDEAYQWAERKKINIHPYTGEIQLYESEIESNEELILSTDNEKTKKQNFIFQKFDSADLLTIVGVPEELMPRVRSLKSKTELEKIQNILPESVFENLWLLADGSSIEDIKQANQILNISYNNDQEDYFQALERPQTKRSFYVVDNDAELEKILREPLEKWRVFLHPQQLRLINGNWNGPVRILGGAGTGKTVVALHRAKLLAEKIFTNPEDKILFIVYNTNLVKEIEKNLSKICSQKALRKIEVINIDKWVKIFIEKNTPYRVTYQAATEYHWQRAIDLNHISEYPIQFFKEEWKRVICPLEIATLNDYLEVNRAGRSKSLTKKERENLWPVFDTYRKLLKERRKIEREDARRSVRQIIARENIKLPYKAVIIDEAQDLSIQDLILLRSLVQNPQPMADMYIVGDTHQQIYNPKISMKKCGINIVGRSHILTFNYRTTEQISNWSRSLLMNFDDKTSDKQFEDMRSYTSKLHGPDPEIHLFNTQEEEFSFLLDQVRSLEENNELINTCMALRERSQVIHYKSILREHGINFYEIPKEESENRTHPGIRLSTIHRIKGVEFDRIILPSVNDEYFPHHKAIENTDDETSRIEKIEQEKSLLYVGATRAKKSVLITSFGDISRFLKGAVVQDHS
jgi:superfamily I DNA/RNA helicase/Txe/YoeB family toxin of Txe-Axe toxin-antitoxin module